MPIDRNELDKRKRPLKDRISDLLAQDKTKAYSLWELIKEIERHKDVLETYSVVLLQKGRYDHSELLDRYTDAIKSLLKDGVIVEEKVGGEPYYYDGTPATPVTDAR